MNAEKRPYRFLYKVVVIILYLLMPVALFSQEQGMVHYTVNDGLPSSNIYRVFQDSKGFIDKLHHGSRYVLPK